MPQDFSANMQLQLGEAAISIISAFCELGRNCLVEQRNGSSALVAGVTVGHDDGNTFPHILTNLGPHVREGYEVHLIPSNEIIRVLCAQSKKVAFDVGPLLAG